MNLYNNDCLEVLKTLPENSIDSIVTDPPYGLDEFMGKKWDHLPSIDIWKEALRVLKPGGHLLSFAGTRTYHRMVVNIEDAGFEIRDQIMWIYGSGFPKSMDISKAIDKQAGAIREVIGTRMGGAGNKPIEDLVGSATEEQRQRISPVRQREGKESFAEIEITAPATAESIKWQGWGTALKPANEPICLARKPISEKTIASNVIKYGTGAININDCKIGDEIRNYSINGAIKSGNYGNGANQPSNEREQTSAQGRWPANIIFDEGAAKVLDEQTALKNKEVGASRFFYCAKATRDERNAGLNGLPEKESPFAPMGIHTDEGILARGRNPEEQVRKQQNFHPTVKPVKLMEYLCKLITPPNGTVLDPFMGSGTTGVAAKNLGFNFTGIERDEGYFNIAKTRISL